MHLPNYFKTFTMKRMFFATAFLLLCLSCFKDRQTDTRSAIDTHFPGNGRSNHVIKVYPGDNATQKLLDAFARAKKKGKGTVIRLMPGEYKVGMIEVREFFGTLTGSGKEKTVITNLPELTPDKNTKLNKLPALITFIGGDVAVCDLTLKTSGDSIPWLDSVEMSMILFSDYAADFTPADKHITVNINNINVNTSLKKTKIFWVTNPDTGSNWPTLIAPLINFNGVKVAPDILDLTKSKLKRTHADVNISNSLFSGFGRGVYIWGCQNGHLNFGIPGGNTFDSNHNGLLINDSYGVKVKVENSVFNVPAYYGNCLDINTGVAEINLGIHFEDIQGEPGDYEVRNNTFSFGLRAVGIGLMDAWRCAHPDNPVWINLTIQHNNFYSTGVRTYFIFSLNMKNTLIVNNTITGNFLRGGMEIQGMYYLGNHPDDLNYFSEGMRIINNRYLQDDFILDIKWDVKDCMLGGDLGGVFIADQGIGTRYVGLYRNDNPSGISKDVFDKMWKRFYGKK
jgi:hypothetical protein